MLRWFSIAPFTIVSGSSIFHFHSVPTGFVWCLRRRKKKRLWRHVQAARLPSIIQNGDVCGRIISIFENNDGKSNYPMGSRDTVKSFKLSRIFFNGAVRNCLVSGTYFSLKTFEHAFLSKPKSSDLVSLIFQTVPKIFELNWDESISHFHKRLPTPPKIKHQRGNQICDWVSQNQIYHNTNLNKGKVSQGVGDNPP